MTSNVEIPGDRVYKVEMELSSDITGGVVIDFVDPKTRETKVMIYASNEDLVKILEWMECNADSLKEKQDAQKSAITGREEVAQPSMPNALAP